MSIPSSSDLYHAIMTNSVAIVQSHLEKGANPNSKIEHPTIKLLTRIKRGIATKENTTELYGRYKVAFISKENFLYPLHAAIINLCHSGTSESDEKAFQIIQTLLKHHADVALTSSEFKLLNMNDKYKVLHYHHKRKRDVVDFIMFIKNYAEHSFLRKEVQDKLDTVMEWMVVDEAAKSNNPAALPSMKETILTATSTIYKKLLFSQELSDVQFKCSDGVLVPAHTLILSASSNYFKDSLSSPWFLNNNQDRIFETQCSSQLLRQILTLIYTGDITQYNYFCQSNDFNPIEFFETISLFDLNPFKDLASKICIDSIHTSNVKAMLLSADLHNDESLKKACFVFIQRNAAEVLTQPHVASLAAENTQLWSELRAFVSPQKNRRVRQRVN